MVIYLTDIGTHFTEGEPEYITFLKSLQQMFGQV